MIIYRTCNPRLLEASLRGESSRVLGGRWNPKGHAVIYAAADEETAIAESRRVLALFHQDQATSPRVLVELDVPDHVSRSLVNRSQLPPDWTDLGWIRSTPEAGTATQSIGADWLVGGTTCLLFVPSVVSPTGMNCLINPTHPEYREITVVGVRTLWEGSAAASAGFKEDAQVFICHASEQRESVVEPLTSALRRAGISYWYDQEQLHWGDSLTGRINEALARCKFVIVVLSNAFLRKKWPRREWQAALNKEFSLGRTFVLPLLVGTEDERREIVEETALQNDKLYLVWRGDPTGVVRELSDVMTSVQ